MGPISWRAQIVIGLAISMAAQVVVAQNPEKKTKPVVPDLIFDCADVTVQYESDSSLTREEKLARMDQALYESLSKFDSCQRAKAGGSKSAKTSDQNSGEGDGSSGGGAETGQGGSVASSDMSGNDQPTESETASASSEAGREAQQGPAKNSTDPRWSAPGSADDKSIQPPSALKNGKIPEDIPPADNDSVLEAQIRQAAINETDPTTKAKLWNEYRKYKGLPQKN